MSKEVIEEIRSLVGSCVDTPVDDMIASGSWGKITFELAKEDLETLFSILKPLTNYPLHVLPPAQLNAMKAAIEPLDAVLQEIKGFSIETGNPSQLRDDISNRLKSLLHQAHGPIATQLPFLAYQHGDVQENLKQLNSSIESAKAILDKAQGDISVKKEELDGIIVAAREASAEVGVAHFTSDFSDEAKNFAKAAKSWLWASGIISAAAAGSSLYFLFWKPAVGASIGDAIQFSAAKLIFLSILIAAATWCGGQFRSAKHQQFTNKHRSNSLKTFRAFSQAASDDYARDAVLMEATRAIFGHVPSGYTREASGGAEGNVRIVEMVRDGIKKSDLE